MTLCTALSCALLVDLCSFGGAPCTSLNKIVSNSVGRHADVASVHFITTAVTRFIIRKLALPLMDGFSSNKSGTRN